MTEQEAFAIAGLTGTEQRAFPFTIPPDKNGNSVTHFGMTLRQYAAIHIAAGLCANQADGSIIKQSVILADALIAELERTEK